VLGAPGVPGAGTDEQRTESKEAADAVSRAEVGR
jgi:hypothetical protein